MANSKWDQYKADPLPRHWPGRIAVAFFSALLAPPAGFAAWGVTLIPVENAADTVMKVVLCDFLVAVLLLCIVGFVWAAAMPKWLEKVVIWTTNRVRTMLLILFCLSVLALAVLCIVRATVGKV
jgi:hypothetical protein